MNKKLFLIFGMLLLFVIPIISANFENISEFTYNNINISTIDDSPRGIFFKSDGTKLYEVGMTNDKIYQYSCSSAWNLSTCSYDSVLIDTQDTIPLGIFFKSDGTKLYEVGITNDKIYQYSCSSAWDLSTCSYDSVLIDTQNTAPSGIFFKSDGTKLYEVGTMILYQYSCSSAWDLSTCSYDSVQKTLEGNNLNGGIFFKPEGNKLYNIDASTDLIYQYSSPFIEIILNSPINTYNTTSQTINFNVTVVTDNQKVENVSLYIDGILNETNTSNVNGTYIFTKTFSDGEYNWSILAYDNDSQSTQSATRTFNITKILENSQTFSTTALGGSPTNLSINFSLRNTLGINYVYLVYDGTNYLGTINNSNDYSIVTYQLTPPVVSTLENKSFYWELYLNDSTTFTSTPNNQTISNLALDNCSAYSYYLYNFTIVDEKFQTFLVPATQNTTAEIDLIVTTLGGTTVATYSKKFEKINPFQICISNNLSNGDEYLIDTEVKYYADNYAQEYYNIQGDILNVSDLHSNITLYSLDNTTSTTFKITYKDENYLPVSDALVTVQRKYISEGVYKTVESPITDSNGETLLHLETDSAIYRFIMSKEGVVLATFDSAGVKCTNSLTGDCNLNFNDLTTSILTEDYTSQGDFTFSISYSNATRTVSTIFSSTGVVDARMNVTLADGNNTYVCSNALNSNSGTLTCVVPLTFANETIIIRIYKNNEFQGQAMTYLGENSKSLYGSNIVFLTIFLYLTLIGLGIQDNPIISGLFMIIGGILAVSINLVEGGGGFIGASATILWLVIAIIIIMIKGSKRN